LPGTATLVLANSPEGAPLSPKFRRAYEYSDCWVEDARLVMLNARDAAARGAQIMTRSKVARAERVDDLWQISVGSHARRLGRGG
jgi:glycerol-3-phosphate dehydrogenase